MSNSQKTKVPKIFHNKDVIDKVIKILHIDYLLRSKEEEIYLVDFIRVN